MTSPIESLRPFSSCDIGDALVKLKHPYGGYLDGITMWSPTRQGNGGSTAVIGQAVTVKMIPASDATSPKASGHFADFNAPEKIMFVSQPKGMYSACFGGLMAARAKVLGAAGVVVDGRFRDVREIQDLGLPLFARQTSILGSGPFTRASAINEPVQFNDNLWVHADDIIVGDKDGVVCVPPTMVERVVELCKKRKEQDERVLEAVMRGATMEESMRKFR